MTNCKLQTRKKEQFSGLYQPDYEHDACGVGMVVNINGGKSHELVDNALKVLENMEHRGAETRDKTGGKESMAPDWYFCLKTKRRSRRF